MSTPKFKRGDYVRKISGSWWEGYVVGNYRTGQTVDGVNVQLPVKNGPVQIYPASALEITEPGNVCLDFRDAGVREAMEAVAAECNTMEAEYYKPLALYDDHSNVLVPLKVRHILSARKWMEQHNGK